MKRYSVVLIGLILMMLLLGGCSTLPMDNVIPQSTSIKTLKSWSIQYNEDTNDFSVFFALLDNNDSSTSADANVDIRIVSDNDEELYKGTKEITTDDFGYYTSQVAGEQYLAEIRIGEKEVKKGTSTNGKLYLTVYKEDEFSFEEVNCSCLYILPVKEISLTAKSLPSIVNVKDYNGTISSTIQIEDVKYKYESSVSSMITVTVSGKKTYGTNSRDALFDVFSYKLYNQDGYVVDSGEVMLEGLQQGDKFKDDSIVVYDVVPGTEYTIKFMDFKW